MRRVAIVQSSYIPWKGYIDMLRGVDVFILYDDVGYSKNDWRNRNRIKTPNGTKWLTIPVSVHFNQPIREVRVASPTWGRKHWDMITNAFRPAQHFEEICALLHPLYWEPSSVYLSQINFSFLSGICVYLGIGTPIIFSSELGSLPLDRTARLVELCRRVDAQVYVSGPSARNYLDVRQFEVARIEVQYLDYSGYAEYPQLYSSFEHEVTILDLLFNQGTNSLSYMQDFRRQGQVSVSQRGPGAPRIDS